MEFDMKSSKLSGNPGLFSNTFSFKTDLEGHISLIDTQIEVMEVLLVHDTSKLSTLKVQTPM
jgi:hypothetical protein